MDYSEPLLELKGLTRMCEGYALHGDLPKAIHAATRAQAVAGTLMATLVGQADRERRQEAKRAAAAA